MVSVERQRVRVRLRLVVVVHARQVPPALVPSHLDEPCTQLRRVDFLSPDVGDCKGRRRIGRRTGVVDQAGSQGGLMRIMVM